MFDVIFDSLKKIVKSRLFPVFIIYFCLFFVLIYRLFNLQIVNGEAIEAESEKSKEQERDIKSTRGNFRDRNGKLLAYNDLSYSVTIQDTGELKKNIDKNAMIHKMITLIEEKGGKLDYEFNIVMDKNGDLSFSCEGSALTRFKKDVYSLNPSDELTEEQIAANAEDVFQYLRYDASSSGPKFEIDDSYTKEEALKIMAVRFALFMNRYAKYLTVTIAVDVNDEIVAAIEENRADLPGVDILQETHRVYNDSKYFAAILGYTGLVTSDNLEQMESEKDKEYYNLTDQIGKTGLEKEYEEYLRGTKGSETLIVNESTRVIATKDRKDPVAGNDVYLTLDSNLQKACYTILEKQIAGILLSSIVDSTDTGTKGISADGIKIPIYDVYFALIDNNIIDITKFDDENATDLEKKVHKKYLKKREDVFKELDSILSYNSKVTNENTTEEMAAYLDYIYSMLKDTKNANRIFLSELVDEKDATYVKYQNKEISLSEFLQYSLSMNWIDLSKLGIGDEYYSTKELYEKLIDYTKALLEKDSNFNKKLYHYLVYSYKLTGKEICLLLFDQGVIEYDEGDVEKLKKNKVTAYDFIRSKIKSLEINPGQLALAPCSGSVVVTEVDTGEVLACVSYPSYDSNKLANTIDSAYFAKLDGNKSKPMYFRPTREMIAPGSTFKLVSAATLLEEGVVTPEQTILDKVSFEEIGPPSPRCWSWRSHGNVNISHAIGVSCNYYFYDAAYHMSLDPGGVVNNTKGLKKLSKYASMFGLDSTSGIELYEEQPHISDKDSIRSAIGQGSHSFAPVQLARYLTTVANSGTCYNLTILDKITDFNGSIIEDNQATVYNDVKLKKSTWDNIHTGMNEVVNGPESTISSLFRNLDLTVAGKTGTAQINTSIPNHGLFISYAPYENPEIAVTAVIPNGYSSGNAAEVARDVYRYYFEKDNRKKILEEEVALPELNRGYMD